MIIGSNFTLSPAVIGRFAREASESYPLSAGRRAEPVYRSDGGSEDDVKRDRDHYETSNLIGIVYGFAGKPFNRSQDTQESYTGSTTLYDSSGNAYATGSSYSGNNLDAAA